MYKHTHATTDSHYNSLVSFILILVFFSFIYFCLFCFIKKRIKKTNLEQSMNENVETYPDHIYKYKFTLSSTTQMSSAT